MTVYQENIFYITIRFGKESAASEIHNALREFMNHNDYDYIVNEVYITVEGFDCRVDASIFECELQMVIDDVKEKHVATNNE